MLQSPQFSKLTLDKPPEFLTRAQATEITDAMAMGVFLALGRLQRAFTESLAQKAGQTTPLAGENFVGDHTARLSRESIGDYQIDQQLDRDSGSGARD